MPTIELSQETYDHLMEVKKDLNESRLLVGHADTDEELINELITQFEIMYDMVADAVWDG
jgi:hypothetical protein